MVARLYDRELVDDRLPAEPHHIPMTAAITPGGGVVELSCS